MMSAPPYELLWVTDRSARHQARALETAPPELAVQMLARPSRDELRAALASAELLVSERRGQIDVDLLAAAPRLRFILRIGATAHDIDLAAARQRDITVARIPDRGNQQVAEHCLLMALGLRKRLPEALHRAQTRAGQGTAARTDANTFDYNWAEMSGVGGLFGNTVAIVGLGDVGLEVARRLQGFGLDAVLYHKRAQLPEAVEATFGLRYASLETCFQQGAVVICLLPYTPQTDHLIDAHLLGMLAPEAVLVQAGSGSTIDETALAEALAAGQLAGAALDTFEYEPLPDDHPLLALARQPAANVLLTPHIAGGTGQEEATRAYQYAEVLRFVRGQPLSGALV